MTPFEKAAALHASAVRPSPDSYCTEGCGRVATHELPLAVDGEYEVVELVCVYHWLEANQ